jgi:hypothetical protein
LHSIDVERIDGSGHWLPMAFRPNQIAQNQVEREVQ